MVRLYFQHFSSFSLSLCLSLDLAHARSLSWAEHYLYYIIVVDVVVHMKQNWIIQHYFDIVAVVCWIHSKPMVAHKVEYHARFDEHEYDVDNNNELNATTWNQFSYFSSYALFIFSTRINPMSATKERYFFALYSGNKFLIAFCFPGLLYFITKFFFPSVDVDKWNEILSP